MIKFKMNLVEEGFKQTHASSPYFSQQKHYNDLSNIFMNLNH